MSITAKDVENTAIKLINGLSLKKLLESFELTNTIDGDSIPVVRGWLMDELERRNPEKFMQWLETEDFELMDKPTKFFL